MKKLAIIGASYLQEPLITKAKQMGIETHVFAWKAGDVGEDIADFFYPISIVEKEEILAQCQRIGIDGICSIASDLAVIAVNHVANAMGLTGNSLESTMLTTDKHLMRQAFEKNGIPSPASILVEETGDLDIENLAFPLIVKPLDRSGSRGITKVYCADELPPAIEAAKAYGFIKKALVEEFAEGEEYSAEYVSWQGQHHFLQLTKKYTTGEPHYIETGHLEPAEFDENTRKKILKLIPRALDSLMIKNGASHSELKVDGQGNIRIIEIGGRMGGDCIGSHLVHISTGIDFVKAVIQIALGEEPDLRPDRTPEPALIRYIMSTTDIDHAEQLEKERPGDIVKIDIWDREEHSVTDSSNRFGYYILKGRK